jgi:hypothetical protein
VVAHVSRARDTVVARYTSVSSWRTVRDDHEFHYALP